MTDTELKPMYYFTRTERKLLKALCAGLTLEAAAPIVGIQVNTAETTMWRLRDRHNCTTSLQLVYRIMRDERNRRREANSRS